MRIHRVGIYRLKWLWETDFSGKHESPMMAPEPRQYDVNFWLDVQSEFQLESCVASVFRDNSGSL